MLVGGWLILFRYLYTMNVITLKTIYKKLSVHQRRRLHSDQWINETELHLAKMHVIII